MQEQEMAMRSIGELLAEGMERIARGSTTESRYSEFAELIRAAQSMTEKERLEHWRKKIERYNESSGSLNLVDGYNCPICKNRGNTGYLYERNGTWHESYPPCKCMDIRRSIERMRRSGLENNIRNCTFEKYEVTNSWQRTVLDAAKRFCSAEDGAASGKWFFIGGAVGSGKTHICTAIARVLLRKMPLHYMTWPDDSTRLKSIVNDSEEYARELARLKTVPVLYIDDFFKPVKDQFGNVVPPTGADTRLAYEILNHRYINRYVTLISTERYLSELMDFDEATASRIAERSRGYCLTLTRDREKNYRLKSEVTL